MTTIYCLVAHICSMTIQQLNNELGNLDIYLLDQILKGRVNTSARILDAGCGEGRNLIYFLNNGYKVWGIDQNPDAIRMLHFILGSKYPSTSKANFVQSELSEITYPSSSFDYVICSAVLHFARSHAEFRKMFEELVRVTASNGQLFIRMTSDIGLSNIEILPNGRAHLPDGSTRYLLTESMLTQLMQAHNLQKVEPLKSVIVEDRRTMTTLVLKKS